MGRCVSLTSLLWTSVNNRCGPLYIYALFITKKFLNLYEKMSLGQEGFFFRAQLFFLISVLRGREIFFIFLFFWTWDFLFFLSPPYDFFILFLLFLFFRPLPLWVVRRSLLSFFLFSVEAFLFLEPDPTIFLPIFCKDSLPLLLREDLSVLPLMTSVSTFFPYSFAEGRTHSFKKGKALFPIWLRIDNNPCPLVTLFGLYRLKTFMSPWPWPLIIGEKELLMELNSCSLRVLKAIKTIV